MKIPAAGEDRRNTFELYRHEDAESAEIRAVHLSQLMRLTPALMLANLISAALVVLAVRDRGGWPLVLWGSAIGCIAVLGMLSWQRQRRQPRLTASVRLFHRATVHASALGACWFAAAALWFPGADGPHQVLIATLVTGMLGAGAFTLAMMPLASLSYVVIVSAGSLVALWRSGEGIYGAVAVLLISYAAVVSLGAMAIGRQATALLRSRLAQARQQQVVSLLLRDFEENASDALFETDAEGRLVHSSPRLLALLGCSAEALPGVRLPMWFARSGVDARSLIAAWSLARPFRDVKVQFGRGENARWWSVTAKPKEASVQGEDPSAISGWRGVVADVTDSQRAENQLRLFAEQDPLTGLANRRALLDRLEAALTLERPGWLLSIDLDHFKAINDASGHSVGDEVLRVLARRLRAECAPEDLLARLGGDEFAVLRLATDGAAPQPFANRLIALMSEPIELGSRRFHVGASVGLARLDRQVRNIEDLMVNADLALYDAKRSGRGRSVVYAEHLGELSRRNQALEWGLREGLASGQFDLHYQPQVDATTLLPVGVEALMRWQHPVLGSISPGEFVPAAERCGLIHELGALALRKACAAAQAMPGLSMAVNVSPVQLMDVHFVASVEAALSRSGLASARLHLEVTESLMLDDAQGAFQRLHALRELGVQVALDDFGTGYSSLAYLRAFPFHTLKIDRSFVRAMSQHEDARAIVEMIVQMARRLGMHTVAEGVETVVDLGIVRQCGCHVVQGYHISRPMNFNALGDWLAGRPSGQGDSVDSRVSRPMPFL